ncbi:hypothetical protein GCM10023192_37880 [Amycolatopsis samaneae]
MPERALSAALSDHGFGVAQRENDLSGGAQARTLSGFLVAGAVIRVGSGQCPLSPRGGAACEVGASDP